MNSEPNSDLSPEAALPHWDEYAVTPIRPLLRESAAVLLETVGERAGQGWRLITGFCFSGGTRYLLWARNVYADPARAESAAYRILPIPTFMERLRSSGPWQRTFAERLAQLEPGWSVAAFCPFVGFVLRYSAAPDGTPSDREEYSIICRTPVWWRTVFGNSWLQVLSGELSRLPEPGSEIICYLGSDHFLTRTRTHRARSQAEPNGSPAERSCRLMMWPHWKRALLPGAPNITPWLTDQAAQGWTLLSQYEGAIYLFAVPANPGVP